MTAKGDQFIIRLEVRGAIDRKIQYCMEYRANEKGIPANTISNLHKEVAKRLKEAAKAT